MNKNKLVFYGGGGRDMQLLEDDFVRYEVKYNHNTKHFLELDDACNFYDSIDFEKALWAFTEYGFSRLLECHVFEKDA